MSNRADIPSECWSGTMLGCYYDQLPHWVVDFGCYALTIRCKGSLPKAIIQKLAEINDALKDITAQNEEALKYHRRSFQILEAYLDKSGENALFHQPNVRLSFSEFMQDYDINGLRLKNWAIMPNHMHLLTEPFRAQEVQDFRSAIQQFKLRSTQNINRALKRSGPVWQKGWYDRWVRNENEFRRWLRYIQMNPVKAGLCHSPEEWIGLQ